MEEKYSEKLSKYIIALAAIALVGAVCWYFKNVIIYILIAVVVSLISAPLASWMRKWHIKGHHMPQSLVAILSLAVVICAFFLIITLIVPIAGNIIRGISIDNIENAARQIAVPLEELNDFLRSTFPQLGRNFRIEREIALQLQNLFDVSWISSILGSTASFLSSFGIGLFSVVFIGFFFIRDPELFKKIVVSMVPDRLEKTASDSLDDIGTLLSRYFNGLLIEMSIVALVNFLGLWLIARLGFNAAIGIAFITGILNIIPYLGPLLGGAIGTALALVLKFSGPAGVGLNVSFLWFALIVIAIFCVTQLIDNFLSQPIIYSTSIKATPLEIFIVLLIAGHISGPLGMIVAIPSYTVVRVIAFRFFPEVKAIRRLRGNKD